MRAGGLASSSCRDRAARAVAGAALVLLTLAAASCGNGGSAGSSAADQVFLAGVHGAAPDVGAYRTDVQLIRLGHASCDGFRSGVSFQQLADRLVLLEGRHPLPSADLGAVINSAVGAYCPQFRSRVA